MATDETRPADSRRAVCTLATAAWIAALALSAALFAHQGWRAITFPYPLDYGEGPLLDQAVRLSRMETIYAADLSRPPWVVANYPPLFPLAQAGWVKLLGPAFWYGRLLSWLAAVGAALCIASILRSLTGARLPALVGALTFLAIPFVACWAPLFRVDALALALSLAGLAAVVRWPRGRGALVAAGVLLTLAIYTRQTYAVAAPLAAVTWLGVQSRWRALTLGLLVLGLGSTAFVALERATGGGFSLHVVTANVNEFSLARLARFGGELARLLPLLLAAGLAYLLCGRRATPAAWRLIVPYLTAAGLVALTIGKTGSNVNYWLECCAALSLATGALVHALRDRPLLSASAALLLLAQTSLLLGGAHYGEHLRWKLGQRTRLDALAVLIREESGPVLADEELGLLPLSGRPIELQPFEMSRLAHRGSWDEAPLLAAIDRREFSAILIHRLPWSPVHLTRWTPAMLERIDHNYERSRTLGPTVVLRPRLRTTSPASP